MILALTGPASCGKSTAAAYLAHTYGFERIRFAGPLKAMLRAFLASAGVSPADVERMIEGDLKEAPVAELAGRTPRYAMQTLGTEFGRDLIHPDLWTLAWAAGARAALQQGAPGVVVEDCRFANEAAAVRALGGEIAGIVRPGLASLAGNHSSEAGGLDPDLTLINDGDSDLLFRRVDFVVRVRLRKFNF